MKKKFIVIINLVFSVILLVLTMQRVSAQTANDYRVSLRRDFGYGAGSNVRGTMTIRLEGDESQVQQVIFLLDEREMATISQSPFKFQFDTDEQGTGVHDLSARVLLKSGGTVDTQAIRYNYITQEEQNQGMKNILLPIGAVVIVAVGISALVQTIGRPKKPLDPGAPRNYGPLGGTICPKCGHPMPRSIMGMNLVVGKLQRCESCGKFVMTVRATPAQLAAAEEAERAGSIDPEDAKEILDNKNEIIEESKYIDDL